MYKHISPPFWTSLHYSPHPTPLGHHRAPSWLPCAIQNLPLAAKFIEWNFGTEWTVIICNPINGFHNHGVIGKCNWRFGKSEWWSPQQTKRGKGWGHRGKGAGCCPWSVTCSGCWLHKCVRCVDPGVDSGGVYFSCRDVIFALKSLLQKRKRCTPPLNQNLISLNDHKAAPRRYLSPASPARPTVQLGRLFHGTGLCLLLFLPPSHFPSGGLSSSDLLWMKSLASPLPVSPSCNFQSDCSTSLLSSRPFLCKSAMPTFPPSWPSSPG